MDQEVTHLLPTLISDLGLILITAAAAVLLFKAIRQPLVLGYLIAGFLAGPHFKFFPSVGDLHSIEVWAEIGVIFLLFSLGLEFSFKKLMKVGGTATITAGFQIGFMILTGYVSGLFMGWSQIDSIFLGAILSMSSTTIILRAFDELNVKGKKFVSIVFGALIIEDIVAILLMVLLTTISVSQQFSGIELFDSVLKLVFFLVLWFLAGIFVIPTLLKRTKNLLNEETLLILSIGLCLMMVILGSMAGFSPALGAFIMGSIIAETIYSERIEHLIKPVKDLFGAIFFVSVGMMINPDTLVEYAFPVLIITLITIFGKTFSTAMGVLVSGQPLKQSIQAGMSLAQIGEFSFIIATLGMTLKVTSNFIYPIIVAVSAITTFTTPYMIQKAEGFAFFLERKIPKKILDFIERYTTNAQRVRTTSSWQKVLQANLIHISIQSIIIIAIILLAGRFITPLLVAYEWGSYLVATVTLLILMPFLWALSAKRVATNAMAELKKERKLTGPVGIVIISRILLTFFFIGLFFNIFFNFRLTLVFLLIIIVLVIIFPKKIQQWYQQLEDHFLTNLNSREIHEAVENKSDLTPWEGHMTAVKVPQESYLTGKELKELAFREKLGINIAIIKRGEITINIPNRNEVIFPDDVLYAIGTDQQISDFQDYLFKNTIEASQQVESEIILKHFELQNPLIIGKTIRDSKLRERTDGLVVGLERNGERRINPNSEMILERGDILWIVGDKKKMKQLLINKEKESAKRLAENQGVVGNND